MTVVIVCAYSCRMLNWQKFPVDLVLSVVRRKECSQKLVVPDTSLLK